MISKIILTLTFLTVFASCQNAPCRDVRRPDLAGVAQPAKPTTAAPENAAKGKSAVTNATKSTSSEGTVLVYKADGSLQCGAAKGLSVEEMEKQLKSIKVLSRDKRPDGLMHIQVCGSPTGMINVYEIPVQSLKEAERLGFKKLEPR